MCWRKQQNTVCIQSSSTRFPQRIIGLRLLTCARPHSIPARPPRANRKKRLLKPCMTKWSTTNLNAFSVFWLEWRARKSVRRGLNANPSNLERLAPLTTVLSLRHPRSWPNPQARTRLISRIGHSQPQWRRRRRNGNAKGRGNRPRTCRRMPERVSRIRQPCARSVGDRSTRGCRAGWRARQSPLHPLRPLPSWHRFLHPSSHHDREQQKWRVAEPTNKLWCPITEVVVRKVDDWVDWYQQHT